MVKGTKGTATPESGRRKDPNREPTLESLDFLDFLDQGVSVFDGQLRLILFNRMFIELLEFPAELAVLGTPFEAFIRFNALRGEYGPGDVEEQVSKRVELARKSEPHCFERVRGDGTVIEVRGNPLPGGGFITTYTDISDRKRAEDALRESEKTVSEAHGRLTEAIETMSEGFALWDADDRLVICNSHYREFYPQADDSLVPGASFEDLVRASVGRGMFPEAIGNEEEWINERLEQHRDPKGSVLHLTSDDRWVRVSEHRTKEGGYVGVRTDITEHKRAEEYLVQAKREAEAADRAKTEFLANISHELRTPLNSILGFSEVITSQVFGPLNNAKYLEYARDINQSGQHLLDLIVDILDVSKIEAGVLELDEHRIDVARLALACERLIKERAFRAGLAFEIDLAVGLPPLMADERRLKQVLLNLLSNAVKFTHRGGTVRLSVRLDENQGFVFAVADNGIGIAPQDIEKVLSTFGQVDGPWVRKHEGTGIGLPLSKKLVELHGGTLTLESEPDKGTTVTAYLPGDRTVRLA